MPGKLRFRIKNKALICGTNKSTSLPNSERALGTFFFLYMFSLPFFSLTFRSWVLPPMIFRVAFSFFSSIFISAEFSSLKMWIVLPSSDLRISAFFAQPILRSSQRYLKSFILSFPGTLSQLNKYSHVILSKKTHQASSISFSNPFSLSIPI